MGLRNGPGEEFEGEKMNKESYAFFFPGVFSPTQVLLHRGDGAQSFWLLPSSRLQGIAQLLSLPLGMDVCPRAFLDEFPGPLVLRDIGQLNGAPFIGGKATPLSDCVPHELGMLGEAPAAAAGPRFAHILCHLVALVEAHGHGQWRATAAAPRRLLWRKGCF